jgi:hypothetical protein
MGTGEVLVITLLIFTVACHAKGEYCIKRSRIIRSLQIKVSRLWRDMSQYLSHSKRREVLYGCLKLRGNQEAVG